MRNYAEQCYKDDHSVAVTKVVDEIFEKGLNGPYNGRKYVGKLIRDIWPEDLPTGPKPGSHRQPDKKKQGQHVK
jgi:hypothetical protein